MRTALELLEAFGIANDWTDRDSLVRAFVEADDTIRALPADDAAAQALVQVLSLAAVAIGPGDEETAYKAADLFTFTENMLPGSVQCDLLRELFGDTSEKVAFDPVWLDRQGGKARRIATEIWESRQFQSMPALADALEEAGCSQAAILAHCRSLRPHVLGCWVLDLLLQRPR